MFVLRQNMMSIPDSLCEAPKIDGCGPFAIYWRIILPLTKIGLVTLTVLTFNYVWNDYFGPMIYLDRAIKRTTSSSASPRSCGNTTGITGPSWQGACISIIPVIVVYALAQKRIIEGVAFTGVKG